VTAVNIVNVVNAVNVEFRRRYWYGSIRTYGIHDIHDIHGIHE